MTRRLLLLGLTCCALPLACDRPVETTKHSTKAIPPTTPPITSTKRQKPSMANTPNNAPATKKTSKITKIVLNRQLIGHVKRDGDDIHIAWALTDGERKLSFGSHVKSVEPIQMIDMAKTQTMRQGLLNWSSLSTANMRQPALLIRVKRVWPTSDEERKRTAKSKMPKVRDSTETQWRLIRMNVPYRNVWRHIVSSQSSDGFGGYKLHSIKWHNDGKTWRITATRQDQLPAYKSRCRRPKPYPVEFIYTSGFFKKQPVKRRGGPCSR